MRHAVQHAKNWKASYGVASIAEQYAWGEVGVHLHLMLNPYLRSPAFNACQDTNSTFWQWQDVPDFCIQLQRHPALEGRPTEEPLNFNTSDSCGQDCNGAVFIGIVQLRKKKKGITPTPVPSLVWLKQLDACPKSPVDALKESQSTSFPPEMGDGVSTRTLSLGVSNEINGECGVPVWCSGTQQCKLPGQSIKSGAKVVGNFANDDSPIIWKDERAIVNAQIVMSGLAIEIGYDTIGIALEPPLQSVVQSYDLALCPLDLGSWPIQGMHEFNYNHEQREIKDTENAKGTRDSRARKTGVRDDLRQSGKAGE
ncbi:MAG: hypothetical protein IH873_00640 [Chloroflexi bacterium]|nr:hypothetical protein [Chloroflexota bacterium]